MSSLIPQRMKSWTLDFSYLKCIYVFVFSVSKERQYIFTLHKLCKEHALPHMVYFHPSFLKNTALAACWGILCLRLRAQESHTQHRGEKNLWLSPLQGWKVPKERQLNPHLVWPGKTRGEASPCPSQQHQGAELRHTCFSFNSNHPVIKKRMLT